VTSAETDVRHMQRALELAARGLGDTNPNPLVGCVVVDPNGAVVGEGWHQRAGGAHAEVAALAAAGDRARGATLYVTLEPCSHQGRTPPCAPRVREAGVARVVVAMRDPNPAVDGRGLAQLRDAGVAVSLGVCKAEALQQNERFVVAARGERPFVLLKAALTLDGRIATRTGDSQWITTPAQRRTARALRRQFDAVCAGVGTVIADDPRLLPTPAVARPFTRVVLDSHLRIPLQSKLVRQARRSRVWVLACASHPRRRQELEARGVRVLIGPPKHGRVSLPWALGVLRQEGIWSLMVEGGSEVLGAFLHARLMDQVALFRAPLLLGGRASLPAFGADGPARVRDAMRLRPATSPSPHYELFYPMNGRA
jgi:diaminohydroxyphosphoribosylaminopyrimidine deaminase/5-amino-6-(5-phosphoribosylamino)uracil reductase